MKKVLIGLGALVGLVVIAFVLLVVLVRPEEIIRANQGKIERLASDRLGRQLTFGDIDSFFLPTLGVVVDDVRLSGPPVADEGALSAPMLEVGELEVRISLWKAIVSLGKKLEVQSLVLRGLVVRADRDAEGRWDFQDIVDKLEEGAPPEPPPDGEEPVELPRDLSFLEGARVERAAIEDARIEIDDAALGRPLAVGDLDLELKDIALGKPITATLHAVLEDGQARTPIDVEVRLAELRKDLSFSPMPGLEAKAKVRDLDVAPWGQLLPASAMAPASGLVDVDLVASLDDDLTRLKAKGEVGLGELVLRQGKTRGQPLTLAVQIDADVDTKAPRYAIESVAIEGTGVHLTGHAKARRLTPTGLDNADLTLSVEDLARVVAVVPQEAPLLPQELTLEGPIRAHVKGNASAVDVALNLDGAHVGWADAFDKKAGRPLNLALKGNQEGGMLVVPAFTLQVDTARLGGNLALPTDGKGPMSAALSSGPVTFASLKELLPPVQKALDKGKRVDGAFEIVAAAKVVDGQQDAEARVTLSTLDLQLDGFTAKGSGALEAKVVPSGERTTVAAKANLDGLALRSVGEDKKPVLDKPAGMPLRLDVEAVQTPKTADLQRALLVLGKTEITAQGGATGLDTEQPVLNLDFGRLAVDFNDIRRTVPGAAVLPPGGSLAGAVKVGGSPQALSTMKVDARDLKVAFAKTRVEGDLVVTNLEQPELDVSLPRVALSFDDLRPFAPEAFADVKPGGRFDGSVTVKGNTADLSTLDVITQIETLRYDGSEVRGNLALKDLDAPLFQFNLRSPELDLDRLLAEDEKSKKSKKPKAKEPPKKEKKDAESKHGLPRAVREQLARVSGTGRLEVKKARFSGLDMKDFVGQLRMEKGVVTFDALDFTLYEGRISGAGTRLDLPAAYTGYDLKLAATRLDLGRALTAHTKVGKALDGKVSQSIAVSGRGLMKEDLVKSLAGEVKLNTDDLLVKTLDVLGPVGAPLKQALQSAGVQRFKGLSVKEAAKGTPLRDVNMLLKIGGGGFQLDKPTTVKTPFGPMTLTGGASFDNVLDFAATLLLDPKVVNQAVGAEALKDPVRVPLQIGGSWDRPQVTGVDGRALVSSVLTSGALGQLGEAAARAQEEAERLAREAEERAQAARAEVERRAAEARQRAEAEARRVQEEAQRRADEARQRAEAEAARLKKEAEERAAAARKQAEEAKKKAEEEARKRAEAAKKKAEEEARKQAEAAKKKAEEEAKKKAKDTTKKIGDALGF